MYFNSFKNYSLSDYCFFIGSLFRETNGIGEFSISSEPHLEIHLRLRR